MTEPTAALPGFTEGDRTTLKRLERLPFSRPQVRLLFLGGLGYAFDGMDGSMIAFLLVPVMRLWGLSNSQVGALGSSVMAGYLVGAFTAGALGDLIGRRKVMMFALFVYTFASLLAAFSPNWRFLFWTRMVAGLGVGAESAIIAPYLCEFVPSRYRGRFIGSLSGFLSFGYVFAALIGYAIVPAHAQGWRIAQVISFLPILMLLWWRRSLPESPRWLIQRGRSQEAEQVVAHLESFYTRHGETLPPYEDVLIPPMGARRAGNLFQNLAALWHRDMARNTFMLWTLWITITFCVFGFFTWIPTLLVKQGMTITKSFGFSLIMYVAQIPGCYSSALLNERLDRKWTIVLYMVLGGVAAYFLSVARADLAITLCGFWLSFFMIGAFGAIYTYTPELYPTAIRSTGMGVASACGRVGGLAAPLIIGLAYTRIGFVGVFTITTCVLLLGALAVATLGMRTAGKSLEQISSEE
ncbi:MAG: MFS transporter [Holophaga sp.]|nr:MFS transporter [Holophaga sp.]